MHASVSLALDSWLDRHFGKADSSENAMEREIICVHFSDTHTDACTKSGHCCALKQTIIPGSRNFVSPILTCLQALDLHAFKGIQCEPCMITCVSFKTKQKKKSVANCWKNFNYI